MNFSGITEKGRCHQVDLFTLFCSFSERIIFIGEKYVSLCFLVIFWSSFVSTFDSVKRYEMQHRGDPTRPHHSLTIMVLFWSWKCLRMNLRVWRDSRTWKYLLCWRHLGAGMLGQKAWLVGGTVLAPFSYETRAAPPC